MIATQSAFYPPWHEPSCWMSNYRVIIAGDGRVDEEQRPELLRQEEDHPGAERLLRVRPLLAHRVAPAHVHVPVLEVTACYSRHKCHVSRMS